MRLQPACFVAILQPAQDRGILPAVDSGPVEVKSRCTAFLRNMMCHVPDTKAIRWDRLTTEQPEKCRLHSKRNASVLVISCPLAKMPAFAHLGSLRRRHAVP